MARAFVSEQFGFLSVSHEQLAEINALRVNKGPLKYHTEHDGRIYPSVNLFEYGKDREGFWGGDDMRDTYQVVGLNLSVVLLINLLNL